MVLLGDEAQVDARFGPFGDSTNLDTRLVHGFTLNIPQAQNSFWTHLIGARLETVLFLTQDRCMVCAERTIG
jgi:hypothetical protein